LFYFAKYLKDASESQHGIHPDVRWQPGCQQRAHFKTGPGGFLFFLKLQLLRTSQGPGLPNAPGFRPATHPNAQEAISESGLFLLKKVEIFAYESLPPVRIPTAPEI
jgi:hypothetical protein